MLFCVFVDVEGGVSFFISIFYFYVGFSFALPPSLSHILLFLGVDGSGAGCLKGGKWASLARSLTRPSPPFFFLFFLFFLFFSFSSTGSLEYLLDVK